MNDDEQNNSNEKPNPLAGGAKRRKPFTRMIDVSDQFMYETFEVGADLSGDELQIQPSNLDARPEEPPELTQSSSGLSSLLGSGQGNLSDEEQESPQVTTFSSLLQSTGEFVRPTKVEKQPLDPNSEGGFGSPASSTFGSLLGGAEAKPAPPESASSFSPPPAFGLPPAQPSQQTPPMYNQRPGQSPLPVLPKYVPGQKSSAQAAPQPSAPPAAPQKQAQPEQPPQVQQLPRPQQPQQQKPVLQARREQPAQPAPPQQPVPQQQPVRQQPVPQPPVPPAQPPRVASSLTPGLGFEVPVNPFGRLTEAEPSRSNQSLPAQELPEPSVQPSEPFGQPSAQAFAQLPPEPFAQPSAEQFTQPSLQESPPPPPPPHSGRPPEPQQRPSGLMGSMQGKSGFGLGRSQSPFALPSVQTNQSQPAPQMEAPTDLDDLIFNSDEPSEPPTSNQTTLSARHRTVRRADFTRPRIPQLDPQDSDVVAASQSPSVEYREESANKLQNKGSRPGRPKPKRGFGKRFSDFIGQIGSAFRKLFKDED